MSQGWERNRLFDGTTLAGWEMAGHGRFVVAEGTLQAEPGRDIGLLWCTTPTPQDFVMSCEWRRSRDDDNSGVFLRFPDPRGRRYDNPAYAAVDLGFEIQIDEGAVPDGADQHRTGAVYGETDQVFTLQPALPVGRWNTYAIRVRAQEYTVNLNGTQVTHFANRHAGRGIATTPGAPSFLGLQSHTGNVAFRNIVLEPL